MKIGCIGCGNMGGGVLKGLVPHAEYELFGHDHSRSKVEALDAVTHRVRWAESPRELAEAADVIILAVKPYQMEAMLEEIRPVLDSSKVVLSLAAAFSQEKLMQGVGNLCPVVRTMPNLPVIVGKGVFALCFDDASLAEERKAALERAERAERRERLGVKEAEKPASQVGNRRYARILSGGNAPLPLGIEYGGKPLLLS